MNKHIAILLLFVVALAGCVSNNQPPAAQEAPGNNAASDSIEDRNTESVGH